MEKIRRNYFWKLLIKTNISVYNNPLLQKVTTGVHKQLHYSAPFNSRKGVL